MSLAAPWALLALSVPLLLVLVPARQGGACFGAYGLLARWVRPSRGPLLFRLLLAGALAALTVAAARPQTGYTVTTAEASGRDLLLVVDLSPSMVTDDFVSGADGERLTRLQAVIEACERFIDGREGDRIGVVFFAQQATLVCPLTFDHTAAVAMMHQVRDRQLRLWERFFGGSAAEPGLLGNTTNIGLGLGEALRCLQDEESEGRAIILVTDGADTRQDPEWRDPLVVTRHARTKQVAVYAIGVGDPAGQATDLDYLRRYNRRRLAPVSRQMLPDYARLAEIVEAGGGKLLRAAGDQGLAQVFADIDRLETTTHEQPVSHVPRDHFLWPLGLGVVLLALCLLLEPRLRGPLP